MKASKPAPPAPEWNVRTGGEPVTSGAVSALAALLLARVEKRHAAGFDPALAPPGIEVVTFGGDQ